MQRPGIRLAVAGIHGRLSSFLLEVRMKWRVATAPVLLLLASASLAAQDLFLRPDRYFTDPGGTITVGVFNGTFSRSEIAVASDRIADVRLVSLEGVAHPDISDWDDQSDTTMSVLQVRMRASGTYVIGASVQPREIMVEAKDFDAYLATNGVADVLEARRRSKEFGAPVRERYSKHVKAVVQVGDRRTRAFDRDFNYPAELIPLDNPYALRPGSTLRVRALIERGPVPNQLVIVGGQTQSGAPIPERYSRTDSAGIARVWVSSRGEWYVKFIHMERAAADTTIDYESRWATLTFEVR
jgi:hypothetical protein